jgi:hypothetical protein
MFKLFKKYAVLDAVETDHYESYCMREQIANGDAGSLYDAERDLLTTYYKSKTTKSGTKRVELSDRHCGLWCAAAEGLLIFCVRSQGKYGVKHWSKIRDFAVMLDTHRPTSSDMCRSLPCFLEAKRIIRQEVSYRSGAMTEKISESALKMAKEIKEACEWLSTEGEENNVS